MLISELKKFLPVFFNNCSIMHSKLNFLFYTSSGQKCGEKLLTFFRF